MVTYTIKKVPQKELHDYNGQNYSAAKIMGFKPRPKKCEVLISQTSPSGEQLSKHEIVEDIEMKRGKKYFPAHLIALSEQEKSWTQIKKDLHIKQLRHFIKR